jgi:molybdopterin molybdotransferase
MLRRLGLEVIDLGVVRDRREDLEQAFRAAAAQADVVITSGGVSVGEADFVTDTLDRIGEVGFWTVAIKPGRPIAFGRIDRALFFGLPGNPVSVMVTFYQLVQPALRILAGVDGYRRRRCGCTATLTTRIKKKPGRREFQRGVLSVGRAASTRSRSPVARAPAFSARWRRPTASSFCRSSAAGSSPAPRSRSSRSPGCAERAPNSITRIRNEVP